jgi:hypothetical protein
VIGCVRNISKNEGMFHCFEDVIPNGHIGFIILLGNPLHEILVLSSPSTILNRNRKLRSPPFWNHRMVRAWPAITDLSKNIRFFNLSSHQNELICLRNHFQIVRKTGLEGTEKNTRFDNHW